MINEIYMNTMFSHDNSINSFKVMLFFFLMNSFKFDIIHHFGLGEGERVHIHPYFLQVKI